MTTFDDRERAFEAKFAHDAEMQFKAEARRAKALGLWAGKELGLNDNGVVLYAKRILQRSLEQPGIDHIVTQIEADLKMAGMTPMRSVAEMAQNFLAEAKAELMPRED
ncbi:MAG: DUF1476 domain-containing protein [Pikeienuella sp.]